MFQLDAIARLLRDNDPATVQLVKSQLLQNPADNAPHLRDLLGRADDAVVTGHVRDILAAMEATQAAEEFDLLCRFFTDDGDIEAAVEAVVGAWTRPDAPVAEADAPAPAPATRGTETKRIGTPTPSAGAFSDQGP